MSSPKVMSARPWGSRAPGSPSTGPQQTHRTAAGTAASVRPFARAWLVLLALGGGLPAQDPAPPFAEPTVVQNYPTNNPLAMDGALPAHEAIGQLIASAAKSIDIEAFYINNEKPGSKLDSHILQPLLRKARSGVKTRILVDDKMAQTYPNDVARLGKVANVEVRKTAYFNQGGVLHCKMVLVDAETFYLGSHNFDWVTFELNHELGVISKDRALVPALRATFEFDWQNAGAAVAKVPPAALAPGTAPGAGRFIAISPADVAGVPSDKAQLLSLIRGAKKSIRLQAMQINAYDSYNPGADGSYPEWTDFSRGLIDAARRNVEVQLLCSNWEFTKQEGKPANDFLQKLRAAGGGRIRIRYSTFPQAVPPVPFSEVDHAKYGIFDDAVVWITTANLTENYFNRCRNYSFVSPDSPALARQLNAIFDTMWTSKYTTAYTERVTTVTDPSGQASGPRR